MIESKAPDILWYPSAYPDMQMKDPIFDVAKAGEEETGWKNYFPFKNHDKFRVEGKAGFWFNIGNGEVKNLSEKVLHIEMITESPAPRPGTLEMVIQNSGIYKNNFAKFKITYKNLENKYIEREYPNAMISSSNTQRTVIIPDFVYLDDEGKEKTCKYSITSKKSKNEECYVTIVESKDGEKDVKELRLKKM
jgi:hypothetical protein